MSSDNIDNAVAEYLRELELRLTGLPVLQRRELLADLQAHITNARAERLVGSETELLEILERLGSPEVVAAAAYEEAGMLAPREAAPSYAEPVLSYAGHQSDLRPLPPVAPPPDPPPAAYAGPFPLAGSYDRPQSYADQQHFGGSPSHYPLPPYPAPSYSEPAKPDARPGAATRIALAVAAVAAVFVLLACLAGGFLMARDAGPAQAPQVSEQDNVVQPPDAVPAEPAPAPTVN